MMRAMGFLDTFLTMIGGGSAGSLRPRFRAAEAMG